MFLAGKEGEWGLEEEIVETKFKNPWNKGTESIPAKVDTQSSTSEMDTQPGYSKRDTQSGYSKRDTSTSERDTQSGYSKRDTSAGGNSTGRAAGRFKDFKPPNSRNEHQDERGRRYEYQGSRNEHQDERGRRYEYRDGRNEHQDGRGSRNEYRGSRNERNKENVVGTGIVVGLKDSFGFIRCMEREEDLYFSMSEAPREVKRMDEVEFLIVENRRGENASRLKILEKGSVVVEVVGVERVSGVVKKVMRGVEKYGRSFGEESLEGWIDVKDGEDVRYTKKSFEGVGPMQNDEVSFCVGLNKMSGKKRAVEMKIEKSAVVKMEEMLEMVLVGETMEEGVVVKRMMDHGVIKCCERDYDIHFEFSQAEKEIVVGTEVSFYAVLDEKMNIVRSKYSKHKMGAYRVKSLPKGTVSFEKLVKSDLNGNIVVEGIENRQQMKPGKIAYEGCDTDLAFYWSDIATSNYFPNVKDTVLFDLVMDKPKKIQKASNVRLVTCCEDGKEFGVVQSMRDEYGFIKSTSRNSDVYFKTIDVLGQRKIYEGCEVSFEVVENTQSKNDKKGPRAMKLRILPKNSIQWNIVLDESASGIVTVCPARNVGRNKVKGRIEFKPTFQLIEYFSRSQKKLDSFAQNEKDTRIEFKGKLKDSERIAILHYCNSGDRKWSVYHLEANQNLIISKVVDPELKQCQVKTKFDIMHVNFDLEDTEDARYIPTLQDKVAFTIALCKKTYKLSCTAVKLVEKSKPIPAHDFSKLERELGIITGILRDSGIIYSLQRECSIKFKKSELDSRRSGAVREGTEVSFFVPVSDTSTNLEAFQIEKVKNARLKTTKEIPGTFTGTITRMAIPDKRKKSGARNFKSSFAGEMKFVLQQDSTLLVDDAEDNDTEVQVNMAQEQIGSYFNSILPDKCFPRKGDTVEFNLKQSILPSGKYYATSMSILKTNARKGKVACMDATAGYKVVSDDDTTEFSFRLRDVFAHRKLEVDDIVVFGTCLVNEIEVATGVVLEESTSPRSKENRINSALKAVQGSLSTSQRSAKGPDGSGGFSTGWRKKKTTSDASVLQDTQENTASSNE